MNTAAIVSAFENIEGLVFAAVLRKAAGQPALVPRLIWPANSDRPEGVSELAQRSLSTANPETLRKPEQVIFAAPITIQHRIEAQVVLCFDPVQASERGIEFAKTVVVALVELAIRKAENVRASALTDHEKPSPNGYPLEAILRIVGMTLEESEARAASDRTVIALAEFLKCQRVSLGLRFAKSTQVLSLSDSPNVRSESAVVQSLGACMDECLDQRSAISIGPGDERLDSLVLTAHRQHLADHSALAMLTIPFTYEDLSGAFIFERPPGQQGFDEPEAVMADTLAAYLGRLIVLRHRVDPGLAKQASGLLRSLRRRIVGRSRRGLQSAFVAGIVALAVVSFLPVDYQVSAEVSIEGGRQRSLVAPFDGYVTQTMVKPGDTVREGQEIARFDDRDFQLDRSRLSSLMEQHRSQYQEAMSRRDRAAASAAIHQIDQVKAQLSLVEERIQRTSIKAPFDGVVVTGDLTQRLGAPLRRGEPLFEVALASGTVAVLMVDDRDIDRLQLGMAGSMRLRSLPGEMLKFSVNRITSVTKSEGGRNRFRVEALIDSGTIAIRPGMQGIAKVSVGRRSLLWIWTHRIVGWARLFIWSYS